MKKYMSLLIMIICIISSYFVLQIQNGFFLEGVMQFLNYRTNKKGWKPTTVLNKLSVAFIFIILFNIHLTIINYYYQVILIIKLNTTYDYIVMYNNFFFIHILF